MNKADKINTTEYRDSFVLRTLHDKGSIKSVTTDTHKAALRPSDAEVLEYIADHPVECLQFRDDDGKINLDDVKELMVDIERKKIIDDHPYSISHGKDGRWRTWVKDDNAKEGRKKLVKASKDKLEEALVEHYLKHDERLVKLRMTLRELYPRWKKFKALHVSETIIPRMDSDWKKYYENSPIIDKPIRELKKLELDEWIHSLIRQYDMTKTTYYNVSMIIRQMLDYAVDLEIVDVNEFRRVYVDGRRMFRKVRKKKDCTQVYSKDEVVILFQSAWNDYRNSVKLIYRLAPLALMFQFFTGVRLGELCALKYSDIENGILQVSRMLQRDTKTVVEHTKTYEDREIILPDGALQLVEEARNYQEEHGCCSEYIFSTTDKPLRYREVNVLLKKYCEKAGILYRSSHSARKTYISSLIDAGININTVRSLVGHADERTTYFNYCFDRTPDAEKKNLLERALAS